MELNEVIEDTKKAFEENDVSDADLSYLDEDYLKSFENVPEGSEENIPDDVEATPEAGWTSGHSCAFMGGPGSRVYLKMASPSSPPRCYSYPQWYNWYSRRIIGRCPSTGAYVWMIQVTPS